MRRRRLVGWLLIAILPLHAQAAEKGLKVSVKSLSGVRLTIGPATFRVEIKGPMPAEPLIWSLTIGPLDRASGVLFTDGDGPPRRVFDVPMILTGEDRQAAREQDAANPFNDPSQQTSNVQKLHVEVAIYKARTGELLGHGGTDLMSVPRFAMPRHAEAKTAASGGPVL